MFDTLFFRTIKAFKRGFLLKGCPSVPIMSASFRASSLICSISSKVKRALRYV